MIEKLENVRFNLSVLMWSNKLTRRQFCDILEITHREFEEIELGRKIPSMQSLVFLANHFGMSLEDLVDSRINIDKAVKQFSLKELQIPERFAIAANSKVRTSYHIIHYLENKQKFGLIERFMEATGVPYRIFGNLDNEINIDFISELCEWLVKNRYASRSDLLLMGLNTYRVNKNSEMKDKLLQFDSLKKIHIFQAEQAMNFFDQNAHYRVKKATDTTCTVAWTHNPAVCDGLKKKRISNPYVEAYQLGVAASLPLFLQLPASKVKMISSLHLGARETVFEIDFSAAYEILKRRRRLKLVEQPQA